MLDLEGPNSFGLKQLQIGIQWRWGQVICRHTWSPGVVSNWQKHFRPSRGNDEAGRAKISTSSPKNLIFAGICYFSTILFTSWYLVLYWKKVLSGWKLVLRLWSYIEVALVVVRAWFELTTLSNLSFVRCNQSYGYKQTESLFNQRK